MAEHKILFLGEATIPNGQGYMASQFITRKYEANSRYEFETLLKADIAKKQFQIPKWAKHALLLRDDEYVDYCLVERLFG